MISDRTSTEHILFAPSAQRKFEIAIMIFLGEMRNKHPELFNTDPEFVEDFVEFEEDGSLLLCSGINEYIFRVSIEAHEWTHVPVQPSGEI